MSIDRERIFQLINAERARQAQKWGQGDCSSLAVDPLVKSAVLTEEVGEVARALLDREPAAQLITELVQVAAVAVAWLESLNVETYPHLFEDSSA